MLKYKYIFQVKYTDQCYQTALGNCYGLKLQKMLTAVFIGKFIVFVIIIFGTLSFPVGNRRMPVREDCCIRKDIVQKRLQDFC